MFLQPKVRRVDLAMFCKSESTGSVEAKYSKSRKTVECFLYIIYDKEFVIINFDMDFIILLIMQNMNHMNFSFTPNVSIYGKAARYASFFLLEITDDKLNFSFKFDILFVLNSCKSYINHFL